jgi:hypothetical protein
LAPELVESQLDFAERISKALLIKLDIVDDLFDIEERKDGFFYACLKPKQFLGKIQFRTMCDLARKLGGEGYVEGAKAWKVKGICAEKVTVAEKTPVLSSPTPQLTTLSDEDYDLKASVEKVGHLYPVLTDSFGNVIDGFHRLEADPDWPKFKVDRVSDPVQLTIARLIANTRRDVPPEEKKQGLTQLVKMTGWNPKQLAESLGWSERTVYLYLPDDLKERPGVGGPKPVASLATQDVKPVSVASLKPQDMSEGQIREFLDSPKVKEIALSMNPSESIPNTNVDSGESIPNATDNSEAPHQHRNSLEGIQVHEFHCSECHQTFFIDHISPKIHKLHPVREVS